MGNKCEKCGFNINDHRYPDDVKYTSKDIRNNYNTHEYYQPCNSPVLYRDKYSKSYDDRYKRRSRKYSWS